MRSKKKWFVVPNSVFAEFDSRAKAVVFLENCDAKNHTLFVGESVLFALETAPRVVFPEKPPRAKGALEKSTATVERVRAAICGEPRTSEEIAVATGLSSAEVRAALKELAVTKTGKKRGTRYALAASAS